MYIDSIELYDIYTDCLYDYSMGSRRRWNVHKEILIFSWLLNKRRRSIMLFS